YIDHFINTDKEAPAESVPRRHTVFENCMVIVMELVKGSDLSQYSTSDAAYGGIEDSVSRDRYPHLLPGRSLPGLLVMIEQLIEGLAELHRHNVAHRDIKPDNIMLCGTPGVDVPCCKLIDVGLCRRFREEENVSYTFDVVSPLFSAPEKFEDVTGADEDGYGLGIDVWALGITLSTLVTPDCVLRNPRSITDLKNKLRAQDPRRLTDEETGIPGLASI
ncbi:hypothetical protein KIPB_011807, partial [Kipferlia bialata]